jgi:integrase
MHDESKSYANVVAAHAALKWFHTFAPYQIENPLDTPICRNILETAKRMKIQPINKKAPITAEIIQKIVEKHAHPHADVKGLRIACLCSLGFSGFFRYSELANISASHIHYEHDHVRIFIPYAKNDIYREGNYVYIKKLGNEYCPVNVLRRYTEVTNAYSEPNLPIFRPLRFFRSSNLFKLYGARLSYTRRREIF